MKRFGVGYIVVFLLVYCFPLHSEDITLDVSKVAEKAVPIVSADIIEPKRLLIPALKVLSPIVGMGQTPEGRMAVPDNYTEVGWYNLGTRPGAIGSAVMGAHVDNGSTLHGVFKNLKKLKIGDDIYVLDQFNNALHYRVTEKTIYPYRSKDTEKVFSRNDARRLNLITCYGTWLPKENTYDRRLVIFAELVKKQKL
ncbi:MAG: class F sortase [Patescibacteria group bacterium]